MRIRPYREGDHGALYDICLKTGDSGRDASRLYRDPRLIGHIWAGPYAAREPGRAFVLEDDAGVAGYVLGALDSAAFHEWYVRTWLPPLRARYPEPTGDSSGWTPDERLAYLLHHPRAPEPTLLEAYPSHLHIDLLPRAQGRGFGRRLLEALLERLRDDGSPGVHLGVGARNENAIAFYRRVGFTELDGDERALWFGTRLAEPNAASEGKASERDEDT